MRKKAVVAGIVVVAGAVGPVTGIAGAAPAGTRVVAAPGAATTGYATRITVVKKGTKAFFRNLDLPIHDVVASVKSGGVPLFRSATVGLNKEAEIVGVSELASGSYKFFCSVHPYMTGTLRVL